MSTPSRHHVLTCQACKTEAPDVDVDSALRRCGAEDGSPKVRFDALRAVVGRLEKDGAEVAIDRVDVAGDVALFDEARRARTGSVPLSIRRRAVTRGAR